MRTVVVLAGGPDRPAVMAVPPGATVIAADGGAELGGAIDLLVGDLDSISAETLAGYAQALGRDVRADEVQAVLNELMAPTSSCAAATGCTA